eukprot:131675_1
MGQRPFEHPHGPHMHRGSRYMPNQAEIDFAQHSRSTLYSNFFRFMILGSLTPYLTLRALSVLQKRVIPTQRYMIWASLGGGFGGMYGITMGRMATARDYLRLEGSPLATEARYQLWKINPSHPFLRGFENETMDWSHTNYVRDDPYDEGDEDEAYDYYNTNRNVHMDRDTQRERDREDQQRRKRDRFYQGRNRVSNNHVHDARHDDMSEFFDRPQGNSPDDEVGEFFETTDTRQKWD